MSIFRTERSTLSTTPCSASEIAHDFKHPLTSIVSFADLLATDEVGQLTDKQAAMLSIIQRSARHLMDLTEQLVAKPVDTSGLMDLVTMLKHAERSLIPLASTRGVSVRIRVADDLVDIPGNGTQMQRALMNLLSNALESTPRSGLVTMDATRFGENIRIEITDTGAGLPEDELGMSIAQTIIENHGGTLRQQATPDIGTTVSVYLPTDVLAIAI